MSQLRVRVHDEHGQPLPARVAVRAVGDMTPLWPISAHLRYDVVEPWGEERSFVCEGEATLEVPTGPLELRVSHGIEWTDWHSIETVGDGVAHEVSVRLERPADAPVDGWVAGDLHVHRPPREAARLARAEGISVVHCLSRYLDIPAGGEPQQLADLWPGADSSRDDAVIIGPSDVEVERVMGGPGALIGLGPGELPSSEIDDWEPFDDTLAASVRQAGGLVDGEKVVWPSIPVLAALGLLDTVELACNHFGPTWTLPDLEAAGALAPGGGISGPRGLVDWIFERYATLLGCGFRLAASGGSGAGVMPNPVGASRVYARVESPLTMASWLAALRAGRTLSTNGPLIDLDVAGCRPGDPWPERASAVRPISVTVTSPRQIDSVELVVDGDVRGAWTPRAGSPTTLQAEVELDLSRAGWIAARAVEVQVDRSAIHFGHTSPVWTGRVPPAARRREAAAQLSAWLAQTERVVFAAEQRRGGVLEGARGAVARARAVVETVAAAASAA